MAPQFAKMQSCQPISTITLTTTFPIAISSCEELTATQLLNSGCRSPSEACTAGAKMKARHRKEISRTGGAKSRRGMLHVQSVVSCYFSVKPKHNDSFTRAEAKRNDRGQSARAVRLGKLLLNGTKELFFQALFSGLACRFNTRCCDGPHMLSATASDEAII